MTRLLSLALAAFALSLSAQTPFLVHDINTAYSGTARSSTPQNFFQHGNTLYFAATTEETGTELWKFVDGQASLVADIAPGTSNSSPTTFLPLRSDLLVFAATTPANGRELWATNGTPEGTRLIQDIHPTGSGLLTIWMALDGKVFFTANDGVHGAEPWVSDGTAEGTRMLADLNGSASSSGIQAIGRFGTSEALIFAGGGLWRTNGTPEGTTSVLPAGWLGSVVGYLPSGSVAYFTSNAAGGRELWKTDGTAAGTAIVREIAPGPASGLHSTPQLQPHGGLVYFIAGADGTSFELWKSDGTDAGTQRVAPVSVEVIPGSTPVPRLYSDGTLVYVATNRGLWRSDGTEAGTYLIENVPGTASFTAAFGGLYYAKYVDNRYAEIWATNGTAATTRLVHSFPVSTSFYAGFWFTGGKLYFSAGDWLYGVEPWIYDGTTVRMLTNVSPDGPPSSDPEELTAAGDLVFFTATDGFTRRQLWRSNGSSAGTLRLTSLGDQWNDPWLSLFTGWRGKLYFKNWYAELWHSDGTEAGTKLLKNFSQGYNTPSVSELFAASDLLYLNADDGDGPVVWRTDGTVEGLVDLGRGHQFRHQAAYPKEFAELAGRVYIWAGLHYPGIWVTEGTAATTRRVTPFGASTPLVPAAGMLFFGRTTEAQGQELWVSDGSLEGTVLVKDLVPGAESPSLAQLTGSGRYLFFVANDGTHGAELWRTDGTADGTILLRDIRAGAESSALRELTVNGDVLYFVADDGVSGAELWRSDGTPAGTVPVADIRAGAASSDAKNLYASDGTLWFSANDGTTGQELWRTTATGGVAMVADLAPGAASSSPGKAIRAGALLYFIATTSLGRELWALAPTSEPVVSIGDVRIVEGNSGTKNLRFTLTRTGNTSAPSTVTWTTADLGATAGADYVAGSGTVTFAAGVTTQFVDVVVNGDTSIEKNESLLLKITGATGAVLRNVSAVGIIEDDDHSAQLALEWISSSSFGSVSYGLRVTNHGPSMATDVRVTFSESPRKNRVSIAEATLNGESCTADGNLVSCLVSSLAVGESLNLSASSSEIAPSYTHPTERPGRTVTVDVRSAETDPNPADNRVSRMVGASMELPPFLVNGAANSGTFRAWTTVANDSIATVQSNVPSVIVTPTSVPIPANQKSGTFTVTPQAYVGRVRMSSVWYGPAETMTIASVQPGTVAKLDVGVVVGRADAIYGNPVDIAVEIAARMHDGTRPTGVVTLVDHAGTTIAQQAVDANGATTFRRTGLAPGNYSWQVHYPGDANFNGLSNVPVSFAVGGVPTETSIEIPPYFCGTADVTIRVRNTATSAVPTGTVNVNVQNVGIATLTLTPSGAAGEAFATMRRTFTPDQFYISVSYVPSSTTFAQSSHGRHFQAANCVAFNFVATATGTSVTATWTAQPGAHRYDVVYQYNPTGFVLAGSTTGTSLVTLSPYDAKVLLYLVHAYDAAGNYLFSSAPDIVHTNKFTNDPIVPRQTTVKSVHITELQTAANSLRFLADYGHEDLPAALPGARIRVARILELRAAINKWRVRLGLPAWTFTDPSLAVGDRIKALHVQELRNALK